MLDLPRCAERRGRRAVRCPRLFRAGCRPLRAESREGRSLFSTPQRHELGALGAVAGNHGAGTLDGLALGAVEQVSVALGSLGLGVAEQLSDQREGGAAAGEHRGERVAQVMYAQADEIGLLW